MRLFAHAHVVARAPHRVVVWRSGDDVGMNFWKDIGKFVIWLRAGSQELGSTEEVRILASLSPKMNFGVNCLDPNWSTQAFRKPHTHKDSLQPNFTSKPSRQIAHRVIRWTNFQQGRES